MLKAANGTRARAFGDGEGATAPGEKWHGTRRGSLLAALVAALALAGLCAPAAGAHALSLRSAPLAQPLEEGVGLEVVTEAANEVRRTLAVLRGRVNPNGSPLTSCDFKYGTTKSVTSEENCANSPGEGEVGLPVYVVVTGLEEHTTYFVKLEARNQRGETMVGKLTQFSTHPGDSVAVTEPATSVTENTATLNGEVNPNGAEITECFFEWGTNTKYEGKPTVPCSTAPGSGEGFVRVSGELSGLEKSKEYDYRLVVFNIFGEETPGGNLGFQTPPAQPSVRVDSPTEATRTTAKLRGTVNPEGLTVTSCQFELSTSRGFNGEVTEVPCSEMPGASEEPEAVSAEATGLAERNTHYYVKLVAGNASGASPSPNVEGFFTLPTKPQVKTREASAVGPASAILQADVNPEEAEVNTCEFEYGTSEPLTRSAKCEQKPIDGGAFVHVSAVVKGLIPHTLYFFKEHAQNEFGMGSGGLAHFETRDEGVSPIINKLKPDKGTVKGGTHVMIIGEYLETTLAVEFGDSPVPVHAPTFEKIEVTTPPGASGSATVKVTTASGTNTFPFIYGSPEITSFTPERGPEEGGTVVTVTGLGFSTEPGATAFVFGEPATVLGCSSITTCEVMTPKVTRAGHVRVGVKVDGGKLEKTHRGNEFLYE